MTRTTLLLILPMTGCLVIPMEGSTPGECIDGTDNDLDGYFDCNDLDCYSHTDCNGGSPDVTPGGGGTTDGGGSTGGGGEDDPDAIASHLVTFEMTYAMALDFTGEFAETMCDGFEICDCTNYYSGTGNQLHAEDTWVTFEGQFTQTDTDCSVAGGLGTIIWFPSSGESYHTVDFDSDLTKLKEWVAHGIEDSSTPVEEPSANHQYWITAMNAPYSDSDKHVTHQEDESTTIEGLLPLTITHDLEFSFNQ